MRTEDGERALLWIRRTKIPTSQDHRDSRREVWSAYQERQSGVWVAEKIPEASGAPYSHSLRALQNSEVAYAFYDQSGVHLGIQDLRTRRRRTSLVVARGGRSITSLWHISGGTARTLSVVVGAKGSVEVLEAIPLPTIGAGIISRGSWGIFTGDRERITDFASMGDWPLFVAIVNDHELHRAAYVVRLPGSGRHSSEWRVDDQYPIAASHRIAFQQSFTPEDVYPEPSIAIHNGVLHAAWISRGTRGVDFLVTRGLDLVTGALMPAEVLMSGPRGSMTGHRMSPSNDEPCVAAWFARLESGAWQLHLREFDGSHWRGIEVAGQLPVVEPLPRQLPRLSLFRAARALDIAIDTARLIPAGAAHPLEGTPCPLLVELSR